MLLVDTCILQRFAAADCFDWLRHLQPITITPAVLRESTQPRFAKLSQRASAAIRDGWVRVETPPADLDVQAVRNPALSATDAELGAWGLRPGVLVATDDGPLLRILEAMGVEPVRLASVLLHLLRRGHVTRADLERFAAAVEFEDRRRLTPAERDELGL